MTYKILDGKNLQKQAGIGGFRTNNMRISRVEGVGLMLTLNEQQHEIETTRLRLHELVLTKKGNLKDPEVTELSTFLDNLIVRYERTKAEYNQKSELSWR